MENRYRADPYKWAAWIWDWNYDKIDWEKYYLAVIDRVIERSNKEEWNQVINFYGLNQVSDALRKEIKYLPDYVIDDVCVYFKIKKEDLACYARKQSKGHWI